MNSTRVRSTQAWLQATGHVISYHSDVTLSHILRGVHSVNPPSNKAQTRIYIFNMMMTAMELLNAMGEWGEWLARRPNVPKKDGALRFGILGAANIGLVFSNKV
jgi:hypothetical protein